MPNSPREELRREDEREEDREEFAVELDDMSMAEEDIEGSFEVLADTRESFRTPGLVDCDFHSSDWPEENTGAMDSREELLVAFFIDFLEVSLAGGGGQKKVGGERKELISSGSSLMEDG